MPELSLADVALDAAPTEDALAHSSESLPAFPAALIPSRPPANQGGLPPVVDVAQLPFLLTVDEAAALLRTTRRAIYARADRGLIPGVVRDGRRVLVLRDDLLRSLSESRATSPGSSRR
jgi:excisionase family DNA binding protein